MCSQIRFTVVIESSNTFPEQNWEAQIWHNVAGPEWGALLLEKCSSSTAPLMNGDESSYSNYRYVFAGQIGLSRNGGAAQFTVRFRACPDADWEWVNEKYHVADGELVFNAEESQFNLMSELPNSEDLARYFEKLSSEIRVEPRQSESPGSRLWCLSGKADPAEGSHSGLTNISLGVPSSVNRYFALVRSWTPWLAPRHGKEKLKLNEDALFCSFLRLDGVHVVLLAVSGVNNVTTLLRSGDHGEVTVKAQSDNTDASDFQVLASVADDFDIAMSAVVYEARKLTRPYSTDGPAYRVPTPVSPPGDDEVLVEKDPHAQWLSEWYDGLTYCTWNGIGQDLTEDKILNALDTLKAEEINIGSLIIDDNWQTLDGEGESQFKRRWKHFEGNPSAFPQGLKKTTDTIRRVHPKIEHIAVWHALLGYWGGISPDGDIAKKYKTKEVSIENPAAGGPMAQAFERGSLLAVHPDDVQKFYDDFFGYLTSVGVDSVKTDAQFFLDLLQDPEDRRNFLNAYQDAWSISSLKHFSSRAISSMSMFPHAIFHSQLPTNKPSILLRNSDDFFPDISDSHPWHVFCNAHNALLTRFLNVIPDWDMFQTSHPYASFHAAARCVSGGPICITDVPGEHDRSLINEITMPTVDARTVTLRPNLAGRTLDMYHDFNERHILRVGSYTGWARTGSGIIGLFNISDVSSSAIVPLMDFPGIHEGYTGQYIVRAHSSGKITRPMQPAAHDSLVSVQLEPKSAEILTMYPLQSFRVRRGHGRETKVAILGLLGKMTGVAALGTSDIEVETNGRLRFEVRLKGLGQLGIYFSDLRDWDIDDHIMVMILGEPLPRKTVWKQGGNEATVLMIDVLTAWKDLGLSPGWSNDVLVQVFVG